MGLKDKIQQVRTTLKPLLKQYVGATEQLAELRTPWHHIGPVLIEPPSPLHSEEESLDPGDSEDMDSLLGDGDQDAYMSGNNGGGEAPSLIKRSFTQVKRRRRHAQAPFPQGGPTLLPGLSASQATAIACHSS